MLVFVLAAVIYALDQVVKYVIRTQMSIGQETPVWGHILVLDYIRNTGAAWSLFSGQRWFLIVVALVVISAIVYVQLKYRPGYWIQIGMGLLLGGALGNLSDRVFFGNVTDYIYIQIINYPVFNLADSAVVVGVLMILIRSFGSGQKEKREQGSLEERK